MTDVTNRDVSGWPDRAVTLQGPVKRAAVVAAAADLVGQAEPWLVISDVSKTDLGFLGDLPPLQHLTVLLTGVRDVSALAHHANTLRTVHLELGSHRVDVEVLGALQCLTQLYLRKDGTAAVTGTAQALMQAQRLEHLVLHSFTLPNLEALTAMPRLRGLALKLGGAPDMSAFPHLEALRFFEAWQVRGLTDLRPVAASPTLEVLWLESLRRAELPDFSGATSLHHVRLDNLPLAGGLAGLAAAPALRQVYVTRRVFDAEDVSVLRRHPTLRAAFVPIRGRASEDEMRLGLAELDHDAFNAWAAGRMGLPSQR